MNHYYVNTDAQSTGEHEVHKGDCAFLPKNKIYLGYFGSCKEALIEAKRYFLNVDGCYFCCLECHKK